MSGAYPDILRGEDGLGCRLSGTDVFGELLQISSLRFPNDANEAAASKALEPTSFYAKYFHSTNFVHQSVLSLCMLFIGTSLGNEIEHPHTESSPTVTCFTHRAAGSPTLDRMAADSEIVMANVKGRRRLAERTPRGGAVTFWGVGPRSQAPGSTTAASQRSRYTMYIQDSCGWQRRRWQPWRWWRQWQVR